MSMGADVPARILLTAFGPFPGMAANPSMRVVARIMATQVRRFARLGVTLETHVIPTIFAAIAPALADMMRVPPDAALHVGVAGRRRHVSVESLARNAQTVLRQDAARRCALCRSIAKGAPALLASTFPAAQIAADGRRRGIDARLTTDAGDYVCNQTLFLSLLMAGSESSPRPTGFIHIPRPRARSRRACEDAARKRPPLAQIEASVVEALLTMVRALDKRVGIPA